MTCVYINLGNSFVFHALSVLLICVKYHLNLNNLLHLLAVVIVIGSKKVSICHNK